MTMAFDEEENDGLVATMAFDEEDNGLTATMAFGWENDRHNCVLPNTMAFEEDEEDGCDTNVNQLANTMALGEEQDGEGNGGLMEATMAFGSDNELQSEVKNESTDLAVTIA